MKLKMTKMALTLSAMAFAGGSWAQDTSSIGVSATVAAACSVGDGTTIAASSIAMITNAGTQTTSDTVATNVFPAICTNGTAAPQFAYVSANVSSGAFRLVGTDGSTFIPYSLHQDTTASLSAVASATAAAHPGFTANGISQDLSLSIKITPAQKAAAKVQAYSDTITITSTFTP